MSQADIPTPTPEDDYLPHQERIEYLVDQKIAAIPSPAAAPNLDHGSVFLSGDYRSAYSDYVNVICSDHAHFSQHFILGVFDGGSLQLAKYSSIISELKLALFDVSANNYLILNSPTPPDTISEADENGNYKLTNVFQVGTGMAFDSATNKVNFTGADRLVAVMFSCVAIPAA